MMQKIRIVVDVGRVSLEQGCSAFLIVFIDKRQRPEDKSALIVFVG